MYRVMIAEDEVLVRVGLKNAIDWASLNMVVIGDVSNGKQAWELYCRERPDIILTDIRMPIMDGLTLIAKVRQEDSNTKIIILTCHEEFEYLYEAMKRNISDYILKLKMVPTDVEETLRKVKAELDRVPKSLPDESPSRHNMVALKGELLKQQIFYNHYSEEEFNRKITLLNLRIHHNDLVICRMALQDYLLFQEHFGDQQGDLIRLAIINIVDEILQGYHCGEIIHEKEEYYLLFFNFQAIDDSKRMDVHLNPILRHISQMMTAYLNVTPVFGVSRLHQSFSVMNTMYEESCAALRQCYYKAGFIFHCQEVSDAADYTIIMSQLAILRGFLGETKTAILEADFRKLLEDGCFDKEYVDRALIDCLYTDEEVMSRYDFSGKALLEIIDQIRNSHNFAQSVAVLKEWYEGMGQAQERLLSPEIYQAIQVIDQHIGERLTLAWTAEQIGLSQNYLSSLFKKELGVSFVDFINSKRIRKAKELLLTTNCKTYEIAERVGFSDESYFSRTFMRITGMRPNAFRKRRYSEPSALQ